MPAKPSTSYRTGAPDLVLLLAVAGLLGVGVVMVFSSSFYYAEQLTGDSLHFLKRELIHLGVGIVGMAVASLLSPYLWARWLRALFPLSLALLVYLVLPWDPFNLVGDWQGAARWLDFRVVSVQPSEVMKLVLVVFLANLMARPSAWRQPLQRVTIPTVIITALIFGLIYLQPNFSTAAIMAGTAFAMMLVGEVPIWHLLLLVATALPLGYKLMLSEDYRAGRVATWLNPWLDPLGSGYHVIQGLYAIGTGGLLGVGLGQSRQKYGWLPEQYGDWIFAILAEELGFVGASVVIGLFALFVWRGYRVALRAPDRYTRLVAFGLTTTLGAQALINIAVVTATFMPTGIPLPFITYGGSSLGISLVNVGILLSISRLRAPEPAGHERYPTEGARLRFSPGRNRSRQPSA